MKKRSPIHAYKRLLANDHDWDYGYLIAVSSAPPPLGMRRQRTTETRPSVQPFVW